MTTICDEQAVFDLLAAVVHLARRDAIKGAQRDRNEAQMFLQEFRQERLIMPIPTQAERDEIARREYEERIEEQKRQNDSARAQRLAAEAAAKAELAERQKAREADDEAALRRDVRAMYAALDEATFNREYEGLRFAVLKQRAETAYARRRAQYAAEF